MLKDVSICSTGSKCTLAKMHFFAGAVLMVKVPKPRDVNVTACVHGTLGGRKSVPRDQPATLMRHLLSSVRCQWRTGKEVRSCNASNSAKSRLACFLCRLCHGHRRTELDVVVRVSVLGIRERQTSEVVCRAVAARDHVPKGKGVWRRTPGKVT